MIRYREEQQNNAFLLTRTILIIHGPFTHFAKRITKAVHIYLVLKISLDNDYFK